MIIKKELDLFKVKQAPDFVRLLYLFFKFAFVFG